MKKVTLISLAAAAVLFTACGEETKKVVAEVNKTAVAQALKKDTVSAFEEAKSKMSEAAEAAKVAAAQMAEEAKVEAEEMADTAAEKAAELTESAKTAIASATSETPASPAAVPVPPPVPTPPSATATVPAPPPVSPAAYAKCIGCHGVDGKTKALGKSAVIAGQDKEAIITSMNEYKAGTKNVAGMGTLMKGQAASMSDTDIEAVADYLSQIK